MNGPRELQPSSLECILIFVGWQFYCVRNSDLKEITSRPDVNRNDKENGDLSD